MNLQIVQLKIQYNVSPNVSPSAQTILLLPLGIHLPLNNPLSQRPQIPTQALILRQRRWFHNLSNRSHKLTFKQFRLDSDTRMGRGVNAISCPRSFVDKEQFNKDVGDEAEKRHFGSSYFRSFCRNVAGMNGNGYDIRVFLIESALQLFCEKDIRKLCPT